MKHADVRTVISRSLRRIAPEADLASVDGTAPLQDELDLDSMDFLNLMIAIYEQTGVEIPERDYPSVAHLDGLIDYLASSP